MRDNSSHSLIGLFVINLRLYGEAAFINRTIKVNY
jgi:hypothetical protein